MKMFCIFLQIISILTSVYGDDVLEDIPLDQWIKYGMNLSVNPCDDFYSYACGSWKTNHEKIGYTKEFNYYSISKNRGMFEAIATLIEEINDRDDIHLRKEKQWFRACMTNDSVLQGLSMYRNTLNKTGGLSVLNSNLSNTRQKWQDVAIYYATQYVESVFFYIGLNKDNLLKLSKPFTRNKGYFSLENSNINETVDSMYNLFVPEEKLLDQKHLKIGLKSFFQAIIELIQDTNDLMETVTIQEFQNMYDSCSSGETTAEINWLHYLQSVIQVTDAELKSSSKIEVNFNFFKKLCTLLRSSSNEVIVNYVHFMTIMNGNRIMYISPDFFIMPDYERSYYCFDGLPIQNGIVEEILQRKLGQQKGWIDSIFEKLRELHIEEVEKGWIDDGLKKSAQAWLKGMTFRWHGYTSNINFEEPSYDFNIQSCTLQNIINFNKAQMISKMEKYINRESLGRTKRLVQSVGTYQHNGNKIFISLAPFLLPVFNISAPIAWTLGNIAFVISHEIAHSVISATLFESGLFTRLYFSSKIHCFKHEFQEYGINGEKTYIESIADYQGLIVSFKLLKHSLDTDMMAKTEIIQGFEEFNAEKLFFLSIATTFCESPVPQYTPGTSHPPNLMRIEKTFSNFNKFAETFECSQNSYMNPEDKCNFLESSESWIKNLYFHLFSDG